jgi:RNA polymerase sigma-70 factor (ECF subfamily)
MAVAKSMEFGDVAAGAEFAGSAKERTATGKLTRRLVKGEEEAYREFYDLYSHRLYGYLFVVCRGNEEQARESLQQTMIKAARYMREFDEEEILWNWLTRVARSCWVDENRKRNRYLTMLERFWKRRTADIEVGDSIEETFAAAIDVLAEEDRVLLRQKYAEGLSVREIAENLGSSEKAIESRLTRARNRVKELLSRKEL